MGIYKGLKRQPAGRFTIIKKSTREFLIKRNNRTIEVETSLDKSRGAINWYKWYFSFKPSDRDKAIRIKNLARLKRR